MPDSISLRAYARHRQCALLAVQRAIKSGRLKESIVYVPGKGGRPTPQVRDAAMADREWDANTLHTKASPAAQARTAELAAAAGVAAPQAPRRRGRPLKPRPAPEPEPPPPDEPDDACSDAPADAGPEAEQLGQGMTLAEASAAEKRWKAKQAELAYKQKSGELVNREEFMTAVRAGIVEARTKLLGLRSKAKAQIPSLTLADLDVLDRLVRECLEGLSKWAPSS